MRIVTAMLLLTGCRDPQQSAFHHETSYEKGNGRSWAFRPDGEVLVGDFVENSLTEAGVMGPETVIFEVAAEDGVEVVVAGDAEKTGAIWLPEREPAARRDYPTAAARWLDGELWALQSFGSSCEWAGESTRIGPVPCVSGREAFAVAPDGSLAFATGSALEIRSGDDAVIVDIPALRVTWDLASERFVAAGDASLHGVGLDGDVAWETPLDLPPVSLSSTREGAITMAEDEDDLEGSILLWGDRGELLDELRTPSVGDDLRGSADGDLLGVGVSGQVHVFEVQLP